MQQKKEKIKIYETQNEMLQKNKENNTGIVAKDDDGFVKQLANNVENNDEGGLIELGALAFVSGTKINVLNKIQESSNKKDEANVYFEPATQDKQGHWSDGKEVKNSGLNNCLYDTVAQNSKLGISGQELRKLVADHIRNNS